MAGEPSELIEGLSNAYKQIADLKDVNAELLEALRFYANPNVYKPHPHGIGFDDHDLSFVARFAIDKATGGQS